MPRRTAPNDSLAGERRGAAPPRGAKLRPVASVSSASPTTTRRGRRRGGPQDLARQRRDDEVPLGLVALAVRVHAAPLPQVLVDVLALAGRHRVQRHRTAVLLSLDRGLVGLLFQRLAAPGPVALGVDDDPAALR